MFNTLLTQPTQCLLKTSELASVLSVDSKTIHNWTDAGRIPVAYRLGATVRYDLEEVRQALAKETLEAQRRKLERRKASPAQLQPLNH